MPAPLWPARRGLGAARAIVSEAARLVPFRRRRDWQAEWEGELWALADRGAGAPRLLRFAFAAIGHAMWERRLEEGMMMGGLVQDVRLALRRLARSPGFALVTVGVLGLGIGANTALFTALNAALLSTPPYPDVDRIVLVDLLLEAAPGEPADTLPWSYPKFEYGRAQLTSLDDVAGYWSSSLTLAGDGPPTRIRAEYVTPTYFDVLGVVPEAGRLFTAAEEAPAPGAVAVLSHAFWTGRYGADATIVGRSITANGITLEVVGVAPDWFGGLSGSTDVWVPVAALPAILEPRRLQRTGSHWLRAVGRLQPGTTLAAARDNARSVGRALTEAFPDPDDNMRHDVALVPYRDARINPIARTAVSAVSAGAILFLLIACGNVATLLLARASSRRSDIAVRAALGAGRLRLIREHLVESLLLAGAGGALGVLIALGAQGAVATAIEYALDTSGSRGLQYLDPTAMRIGPGTLAAGMLVALATGLVVGLVPAWSASRASPGEDLRRASTVSRGRGAGVARGALVGAQLATTLVLLAGAGLMTSSFVRLAGVRTGFTNGSVLTLSYDRGPGSSDAELRAFLAGLLADVRALPSVTSASAATCPPLAGRCEVVGLVRVDDEPPEESADMTGVLAYSTTDDYLATIGTTLLEGRFFDARDADGPPVVVVSEAAAREHFPGASAVGHRIDITHSLTESAMATVVGVVGDVRYAGLEEEPMAAVYLSEHQVAMPYGALLIHTAGDPYAVLDAVRRATAALDPTLPLFDVSTLAERSAAATARTRIILALLVAFGLSGLLIGALGLYGIVAHAVSRRTPEVGLRIALGADAAGVVRMMFARPAAITLASAAVGVVAAAGLAGYLDRLLYGTRATDPGVLAAAALLLLAVTTVAAWIPARRATRIHPTQALRGD